MIVIFHFITGQVLFCEKVFTTYLICIKLFLSAHFKHIKLHAETYNEMRNDEAARTEHNHLIFLLETSNLSIDK